ncbi:MAG: hypothetical protein V4510_04145 [bacterium]
MAPPANASGDVCTVSGFESFDTPAFSLAPDSTGATLFNVDFPAGTLSRECVDDGGVTILSAPVSVPARHQEYGPITLGGALPAMNLNRQVIHSGGGATENHNTVSCSLANDPAQLRLVCNVAVASSSMTCADHFATSGYELCLGSSYASDFGVGFNTGGHNYYYLVAGTKSSGTASSPVDCTHGSPTASCGGDIQDVLVNKFRDAPVVPICDTGATATGSDHPLLPSPGPELQLPAPAIASASARACYHA